MGRPLHVTLPVSDTWRPVLRNPRDLALSILSLGLLVPLVVYASVGSFARYVADDYCTASIVRTQGFLAAQLHWYTVFSPRFAFTFVVSLAELAGAAIVPLLPAAALLAWLAALTWTILQFTGPGARRASLVVAELVVFATLSTTPDIAQSLYWQTGMLTYSFPLILFTLYVGWVRRSTRRGPSDTLRVTPTLILSAFLPFISGGLSETYLAFEMGALCLGIVAALLWRKDATARAVLPHLVVGLAGATLAFGIIKVSPSVAGREATVTPSLFNAVKGTVEASTEYVRQFARWSLPIILLCVAVPALLRVTQLGPGAGDARGRGRIDWPQLAALTVAAVALLEASFFPAFFSLGGNPPRRSLIVPQYMLTAYLLGVGYLVRPVLVPLAARLPAAAVTWLFVAMALVPLSTAATAFPERASAAAYATQWDQMDGHIRAARDAGATDLTVEPLPRYMGERWVGPDRRDWFNACVARYYGLATIASNETP